MSVTITSNCATLGKNVIAINDMDQLQCWQLSSRNTPGSNKHCFKDCCDVIVVAMWCNKPRLGTPIMCLQTIDPAATNPFFVSGWCYQELLPALHCCVGSRVDDRKSFSSFLHSMLGGCTYFWEQLYPNSLPHLFSMAAAYQALLGWCKKKRTL